MNMKEKESRREGQIPMSYIRQDGQIHMTYTYDRKGKGEILMTASE